MRYLLLLALITSGCTSFLPSKSDRQIASRKNLEAVKIEIKLSQDVIFANGINAVFLNISLNDEAGNLLALNPSEIDIVTSIDTKLGDLEKTENGYRVSLTPKLKSPSIKIFVSTKMSQSQTIVLKTTIQPLRDKLTPLPFGPSGTRTVNGLDVSRQDTFLENQYEAFSISNSGINSIVPDGTVSRSFSFEFEEQVRQNISIMVSETHNGTSSHEMFSQFMIFPRLIIPYAEIHKNDETSIALTNGEELRFNKGGEIINGVFTEGPADLGTDRFTRAYADLKYQGKGILLRANARGQMPQQGQFEATKIDMEYGNRYSSDVLIINGTTGERCRRPKKDFWSDADVTPIQFKFPTDAEFDAYLKANCKFGIPEMTFETNLEGPDSSSNLIPTIWQECKDDAQIRSCIDSELTKISDVNDRSRVKFEMKRLLFKAKLLESETIDSKVASEINSIRPKLLIDVNWVNSSNEDQIKDDCLKKSLLLNSLSFRFNNAQNLMKPGLMASCETMKLDLDKKAQSEIQNLIPALKSDFSWVDLSAPKGFTNSCQKEFFRRYTNLTLKNALGLYSVPLASSCSQIENSNEYKEWLSTQSSVIEERLFITVQASVNSKTDAKAQSCLIDFPMNTALNRIRFKKQREACLIDAWPDIEITAIAEAKKDPLAQKVGVSAINLSQRLEKDRRLNQLKLIKKYFQL